jgi:predicted amino acid racemase
MTGLRLEIDLDKLYHNTRTLVERLDERGMSVTGIVKATLGSPEIARTLLRGGVSGLGDARIENIERMRRAGVPGIMTLVRSPMLSQVDRVVAAADVSFNTELNVIRSLSATAVATKRVHGIVLMVELGDLREGIMPADLLDVVRETLRLPNVMLKGIGTNLACRSGTSPDARNMAELSALACLVEASFDVVLEVVSGGNSANIRWAFGTADHGRINDLRLGEALLLGREALRRQPIDELHTDAITLVAEVVESKIKPSQPWGSIAQNAFGEEMDVIDRGRVTQSILALGRQDTDCAGLHPPPGIEIVGSSSDHLVVLSGERLTIGGEVRFQLEYGALLRAMTSPFVAKVVTGATDERAARPRHSRGLMAISTPSLSAISAAIPADATGPLT